MVLYYSRYLGSQFSLGDERLLNSFRGCFQYEFNEYICHDVCTINQLVTTHEDGSVLPESQKEDSLSLAPVTSLGRFCYMRCV